jgi:putative transposase
MIDFVRAAFRLSMSNIPACRATYHYRSRRPEQAPLRQRIREIAETRIRYGYRRITVLLRGEGWHVNVERVHRLYRLEGLQIRFKPPRRRVMAKLRDDRSNATGPNQVWAMDWMHDELSMGCVCGFPPSWTWSRVCPVMRVCRSMTAMEVIDALEQARRQHGLPTTIGVDQGSQFTSKERDLWDYANGITLDFRPPRQADRQCLRGKLQRHGSARVPRSALVSGSGRRPRKG